MATSLHTLDRQLEDLRQRHPGWRIWYVPGIGHTTWCAQPLPLLNEHSAEDLRAAITEAEAARD
jgi:hypothetical protein